MSEEYDPNAALFSDGEEEKSEEEEAYGYV